ncbi:MAG: hypothetical protein M3N18_03750 [Actinomycetota bacterium]|nr:hypothetical protein [Actinomycetota bacterium]
MTEETDNYTVDEAARILELSPACVRQMLRAGELEGERREERLEGVLGPWRIPGQVVHNLREAEPDVLQAKRRAVCDTDATTTQLPPGESFADALSEGSSREISEEDTSSEAPELLSSPDKEISEDMPSEASELLSESVREAREKTEALREELGILEGRLEAVEIAESALRKDLRREKERADRELERADELQAELDAERARRREGSQESGQWLFKG